MMRDVESRTSARRAVPRECQSCPENSEHLARDVQISVKLRLLQGSVALNPSVQFSELRATHIR